MKKVLFLIHDLGHGGAEKVLVNLVNHLDRTKYDVTVMALFGGGVNESFLAPHVHLKTCFKRMIRGNSHLMKLLSPRALHKWLIKDTYDIEVSYLEGPSARIISGCPHEDTALYAWIHCTQTPQNAAVGFRSLAEATRCYAAFRRVVCVSHTSEQAFRAVFPSITDTAVVYNTNDSERILQQKDEPIETAMDADSVNLISVGRLIPVKGYERLAAIHVRLKQEGYPVHTYLLGEGDKRAELETYIRDNGMEESFTFLGYQTNPYKYVAACDLFVCSSYSEGFSTAATESLIVGTPVCTVEVSGMKEMLGEQGEYGVVTDNDEEALYRGIKMLLDDPALLNEYAQRAAARGKAFSTAETVAAVERLFDGTDA